MSSVFERLWCLAFSYLLGYSLLGFCWACYRERPPVESVAGRAVLLAACLLAALFVIEAFSA